MSENAAFFLEKIKKIYARLESWEQAILQLFSICYHPVSRSSVLGCIKLAGIGDARGNLFTPKSLKPVLNHMLDQGLLYEVKNELRCDSWLMETATRDAINENRFDIYVKAVRLQYPKRISKNIRSRFFSESAVMEVVREVRIGIYQKDFDYATKQLEKYNKNCFSGSELSLTDVLFTVFQPAL